MAFNKIEINGGVPIKYWRVASVSKYDPDNKNAVIIVKGYFDEDTRRNSNEHFKTHEFLVANTEKLVQNTRQATLEEKKERLSPVAIEGFSDEEISAISFDVVESEEVVVINSFDEFQVLYEQGKWQEAAYQFLKSESRLHNDFFKIECEDA